MVRSDRDTGRDSIAGLSRDTAGANGSIGKIFDKDKLREQLEMQQAFGQLGMQIAGDVSKRLAEKDANVWGEGKPGRIALHAVISGLGAAMGGGNVAGAIGGTIAGDVATSLVQTQIEKAVAGLPPNIRDQVANVIANVVAGGAVGGASGASGALFADMYNRQLHPEEKALATKVAEAMQAQGKEISADYIEAQMRQMGVVIDGVSYPGVPDVQIGGVNQTDAGATWSNEPGSVVFVQNTTKADAAVQALILDIINNSSVPNLVHYLPAPVFRDTSPRMGYVPRSDIVGRYCVTAECAAALVPNMTPLGHFQQVVNAADNAAWVSSWAGRVAASATVAGNAPVVAVATSLSAAASLFEQMVRPNPKKSGNDAFVDFTSAAASNRYPYPAPVFTEMGGFVKGMNSGFPFK
ncbi:hypothetical protein [Achromobacter sp. UMC71]|uniref:hypothetical protein n=1 Tax=Achromobacter sp. UMC71 TaxID=1862320 RepID=UPI0016026C9E|nr:hypothetical protein [Achromobacter sp. UMC71]